MKRNYCFILKEKDSEELKIYRAPFNNTHNWTYTGCSKNLRVIFKYAFDHECFDNYFKYAFHKEDSYDYDYAPLNKKEKALLEQTKIDYKESKAVEEEIAKHKSYIRIYQSNFDNKYYAIPYVNEQTRNNCCDSDYLDVCIKGALAYCQKENLVIDIFIQDIDGFYLNKDKTNAIIFPHLQELISEVYYSKNKINDLKESLDKTFTSVKELRNEKNNLSVKNELLENVKEKVNSIWCQLAKEGKVKDTFTYNNDYNESFETCYQDEDGNALDPDGVDSELENRLFVIDESKAIILAMEDIINELKNYKEGK